MHLVSSLGTDVTAVLHYTALCNVLQSLLHVLPFLTVYADFSKKAGVG